MDVLEELDPASVSGNRTSTSTLGLKTGSGPNNCVIMSYKNETAGAPVSEYPISLAKPAVVVKFVLYVVYVEPVCVYICSCGEINTVSFSHGFFSPQLLAPLAALGRLVVGVAGGCAWVPSICAPNICRKNASLVSKLNSLYIKSQHTHGGREKTHTHIVA